MKRLVVIGAGVMGANHVRVAAAHRDWELVAVADADLDRARAAAGASQAACFADVDEMLRTVEADAAVVAVPTRFHVPVATSVLQRGLHVLVEKPIAPTPAEADALIELAARQERVLMVGHVERFNAAVRALLETDEVPVHVDAARIGPYSARVADSVVADLMIHDLDIVRALARSEATSVSSIAQHIHGDVGDLGVTLLTFESGMTATCTASRLGQQKIRELRVTYRDRFVVADLIRQDISINRVAHTEFLAADGARYRQSGVVEIPFLDRVEPLAAELEAFHAAIVGTRPVAVTGTDGLRALELVDQVERSAAVAART